MRPLRSDEPALRAELGFPVAAGAAPAWRRGHTADRQLPALADPHGTAVSLSGEEVSVLLAAALGPLSSSTLRHVASLRAAKLSLHAQGLVVRENKTVRLAPHLDTGALRTLAARSFPS